MKTSGIGWYGTWGDMHKVKVDATISHLSFRGHFFRSLRRQHTRVRAQRTAVRQVFVQTRLLQLSGDYRSQQHVLRWVFSELTYELLERR